MKKFLLFFLLCATINCEAQQKKLDSLLSELNKHIPEDTIKLNLLTEIAIIYKDIDPDKGLSFADKALQIADKTEDKFLLAKCYNAKAVNLLRKGENDEAMKLLMTDLDIYRNSKNYQDIASIQNSIATVYYQKTDYNNAIKYDISTANIYRQANDKKHLAPSLTNIGSDYFIISDFTHALEYLEKGLSIAEQILDSSTMANAYANMIQVYNGLNNFDKALENAQKALTIYKNTGNIYLTLAMLTQIGQLYYFKNDLPQALIYYNKTFQYSQLNYYENIKAAAYNGLGMINSQLEKYQPALNYLDSAKTLFKKTGDKQNLALALNEIGKLYYKTDRLKQPDFKSKNNLSIALEYQHKALESVDQIGSLQLEVQILEDMSNIYEKQHAFDKALYAYRKSAALKDSILNDDKKQQITRLEMQYNFNKSQDSTKVITDKQQAFASAQIKQQRTIRNSVIAGAAIIIASAFIIFILYKKRMDATTKQEQAEVNELVTDTEMKALRSQMNPHFIFNSLNSIVYYINENQNRTATEFTGKFARLMRMVLENSEHKEISLENDLTTLELYMQLENERLRNKFIYEIKVDKDIHRENTLVPPLILQPLVENSIWHGIANKEGQGNITIHIKKEGDMINCIVEDNGGGIQETNIISEEKKSLGMKITKARIDIINRLKNANASMNISSNEQGVKAEVKLPIQLSF